MTYPFSDKISTVKPSAIREILKTTADPNVISFAAGNPAAEAFPAKEVAEISASIFERDPVTALQYSISEGDPRLRALLREKLKEKQVGTPDDDLLIVSGAQQGIDLFSRVLLNDGDVVLCETPSFVGALNAFKTNGARLVGIPLHADGVDPEELEQAILQNQNVRFFYIIPNFQNPSGITTSLEKRKAIYEVCKRHGVCILEDDPYGDLRFAGADIPPIKSLDRDGIVVYSGSFSKVLSPGIRVGHITANKEIINRLVVAKQASDVHTNIWAQMICYAYLTEYDFDAHLTRLREIYRHKARLMLDCIDAQFSDAFSHTVPEGGLFIWCTAPAGVDTTAFAKKALEKQVAIVPGVAFLPYEAPSDSFRLNFSTPSDAEIVEGITRLGAVTKSI